MHASPGTRSFEWWVAAPDSAFSGRADGAARRRSEVPAVHRAQV